MKRGVVLAAVCLVPFAFNASAIGDPYGTAEDGLNPALWGLGARNLLKPGVDSKRGALVAPYPGTTGNGIYAHHPPLPVWVMTVPVALGGWEGWARLIALGCAASTLWLLDRLLRRFFEGHVALMAVAAIAFSGFLLDQGKLFNTLTLAAPLFVWLLDFVARGPRQARPERGADQPPLTLSPTPLTLSLSKGAPAVVVGLLVLSSWDGVLGAGVLCAVLLFRRQWLPAVAGGLALAFVAWHLIDATGGTHELKWQLQWRASGEEFTAAQWLTKQGEFLSLGLGPLTLAALVAAPFVGRRHWKLLALAAAPGVGMMLGFRQGAQHHAFWGYLLIVPAAVALAVLLSARRWAGALLAAQAAWLIFMAWGRLEESRAANQVGALVAQNFAAAEVVPMRTHYQYHPYVTWYAPRARPDYSEKWPDDALVLVEVSRTPLRWEVLPASAP